MTDIVQIPFNNLIENLGKSTMFHMSLGSKELFHSNFLHWISITNWDAFLKIMHDLSDTNRFWWEDIRDCYNNNYHPKHNNIEVRREYHNFDLSIYILDSEKPAKESKKTNGEGSTDEISINTKGESMVRKWIPVLILENKMKSLPYEEQLERYSQKAFSEWCTSEKVRMEAKNIPDNVLENKYNISFVLLSLMEPTLKNYIFKSKKSSLRPKYTLKLTSEWKHKTYDYMLKSIRNYCKEFDEKLNKPIVEDYCEFVDALCNLAKCYWKIIPDNSYRSQIFPWDKDNPFKSKIEEIEEYKRLRIHDIHEKLLYDQLLSMLEHKLKDEEYRVRRLSKESVQEQVDTEDKVRIFTNSNYAHGVGIFEVQYILSKSFRPIPNKKELFKLIIQVQGQRYCHMVVYDNIVNEEKSLNMDVLEKVWDDNLRSIQGTIDKYISIEKSNNSPDKILGINLSEGYRKYGENLIYQYVDIPSKATVQDVIDAIVEDIIKIKRWFK